ncbi:MAG: relaxase domain-containing protein [Sphingomonadales bacterium]|nr:relaxase domain-containing protein [Sphingomonadales bacterium]
MINVGSIGSAGGTAEYHTSKESQLEKEEFQGTEWLGEAAAELGLTGEASKEELETVFEGDVQKIAALRNEEDKTTPEDGNLVEKNASDQTESDKQEKEALNSPDSSKDEKSGGQADGPPSEAIESTPQQEQDDAGRQGNGAGGEKQSLQAGAADATQNDGKGGISQTNPDDRQKLGTELIFSAPKSVSILAVTHGDDRLVKAWRDSVASSLAYIEKNYAQAKISDRGNVTYEKTGNLAMTRVTHGYDDAGRPHLHDHVSIANITKTADGTWRALDNRMIWRDSALMSSAQLQDFANRIRPLGYELRQNEDKRGWDIAAVPRDVVLANSPRGRDIKEEAEGKGNYGAERIARYDTRSNVGKKFDADVLNSENKAFDKANGFDGAKAVSDAIKSAEKSEPATSFAGKVRQTITQSYKEMVAKHDAAYEAKIADSPYLPKNIKAHTRSTAEMKAAVALASGIAHKEQFEAAFKEREAFRFALDQNIPGVTLEMLKERMNQLKSDGLIVDGVSEAKGMPAQYITTKDALATESKIIANIEEQRGKAEPFMEKKDVEKALEPHLRVDGKTGEVMQLKSEQMSAASLILTSRDRYVNIQGFSGTGKTTMLGPVFEALKDQGHKVMGIGPDTRTVEEMKGVGVDTRTNASFFIQFDAAKESPQKLAEMRAEYSGALMIMDEASKASNKDMLALTEAQKALGIEKVVTIGDKGQKQSVLAGKAFEVVQTIKTAHEKLTDVVRHSNNDIKRYNEHIRDGRVDEAFAAIRDNFVVNEKYLESATKSYMEKTQEERAGYYLITVGNKDRETINSMVQKERLERGEITGPAIQHKIHEQKVLSDQQLRMATSYNPGDKMEVHKQSRSLGLSRGDYTVTSSDHISRVTVQDSKGTLHSFDPRKIQSNNISRPGQDKRGDSITLSTEKTTALHAGDIVRFNRNLKEEKIINGDIATVKSIDEKGITYAMGKDREVTLEHGHSQNNKLTLGYALNVDKVQGGSKLGAIMAAGSKSPLQASLRDMYVGPTRAIAKLEIHTNSVEQLMQTSKSASRDSTSALEKTGQLPDPKLDDFKEAYKNAFGEKEKPESPQDRDEKDHGFKKDDLSNDKLHEFFGSKDDPNKQDSSAANEIATRMSIQDDFKLTGSMELTEEFRSEMAELSISRGDNLKDAPKIKMGQDIAETPQNNAEQSSSQETATQQNEDEKVNEMEKTRDFDIS